MRRLVLEYENPISLDSSITQAIQREITLLALAMRLSKNALAKFEQQYQMSSAEFFTKMEQGEMSDTADFIEWAGEYELFRRAENKLHGLHEVRICA